MSEFWSSVAPGSRHGLMICGACGQKISEGEYRIREKPDRYITHHRACCSTDPGWKLLDKERRAADEHQAALLGAATAFRDQWKVRELDELISELRKDQPHAG